jgi:hypothetical protein
MLCQWCKDKETKHPDYMYAVWVEEGHVRAGDTNFPGVGWPGWDGRVNRDVPSFQEMLDIVSAYGPNLVMETGRLGGVDVIEKETGRLILELDAQRRPVHSEFPNQIFTDLGHAAEWEKKVDLFHQAKEIGELADDVLEMRLNHFRLHVAGKVVPALKGLTDEQVNETLTLMDAEKARRAHASLDAIMDRDFA